MHVHQTRLTLDSQLSSLVQELCADCASAKALFDKATEILGYDLLEVCTEGECQPPSQDMQPRCSPERS